MIKKRFFMPLLAALALSACSESNAPDMPENEGNDFGYVAVNIVQANENGSRATENFAEGSEAENYAQNGLFFIFNANGTLNGTAQTVPLTPASGTTTTPQVEKIYNAVLVVDGVKEDAKPVAGMKIVCVLNAPADLATGISTIDGLKTKIADYATGRTSKGTFIMTNSVYDADGATIGTEVAATNIATSASAALNNPVDIYVERIVSKVNITTDEAGFTNSGAKPVIDGVETELDIVITGIEIANIAQKSYLFKNVAGINSAWNWVWDAPNYRSYWETVNLALSTTPVYGDANKGDFANQSYNQIITDGFNINSVNLQDQYIQPNTSGQKTSVLVTAKLCPKNTTTGLDFVYYKGYFSPAEALKLIATEVAAAGFWMQTSDTDGATTYSTLEPGDFVWKNNIDLGADNAIADLEDYEVVARFNGDASKLYKKVGNEYVQATADELNTELAAKHARFYNQGRCYYFVEIDQTPAARDNGYVQNAENPEYFLGVVRNHIYNLSLKSIGGLGTPVFDPEDVIIPKRPEDETLWYLAASIKVLKWKVVSQTVNFPGI